jgi:hypothetical protein
VTAPPTNAVAQIDQQIAELAANGRNLNAKELTYLEGLKADLTQGGGLSVDGLRAQRTGLRQRLENAGVYSSDFERRIGIVMDDASKDMEAALRSFPQALTRYKEGDKLWRQQAEFRQEGGRSVAWEGWQPWPRTGCRPLDGLGQKRPSAAFPPDARGRCWHARRSFGRLSLHSLAALQTATFRLLRS